MENNERDRKLDQWLDEALSEYSAAEPRFGLEQRVLKRIRSEKQGARKSIVWRWIPAFAAIAAVIVVAVAVRPMLEKKELSVQQTDMRLETNSAPAEQKGAAEREVIKSKADSPDHNRAQRQPAAEMDRKYADVRREKAASDLGGGDRDKLSRAATQVGLLDSQKVVAKSPALATNEAVTLYNAPAAPTPSVAVAPPPPPLTQAKSTTEDQMVTMEAAGVTAEKAKEPQSAKTEEVRASSDVVELQTPPAKSLAALEPKDRRKMGAAKTEANREDANVIDAFGVKVRFQTGPQTQQFPTPVPLSKQEKLALAAGRALKDSNVAEHKSGEISPIEIKKLEIKPLEGPEKEK